MKKILTLFVAVIAATTVFAQTEAQEEAKRVILGERKTSFPKSGDDRDVIYRDNRTVYGGTNRYPERYPSTSGSSRERQVYEINREYETKIYSIRNNRTLSRSEKERIIRQLESERRRKINQLNGSYYEDDDRCDDDKNYKKSKPDKSNNGNHYGWERGNGNARKGK